MTRLVAEVAVATSIAPNDLLDASPEVFWAIVAVLQDRANQSKRGRR